MRTDAKCPNGSQDRLSHPEYPRRMDWEGAPLGPYLGPGNLHTSHPSPGTKTAGTGSFQSSRSWGWTWWVNRVVGHCWALAHTSRGENTFRRSVKFYNWILPPGFCFFGTFKTPDESWKLLDEFTPSADSVQVLNLCLENLVLKSVEHLYEWSALTSAISSCFRNQSWTISLRLCTSSNVCSSSTRSSSH